MRPVTHITVYRKVFEYVQLEHLKQIKIKSAIFSFYKVRRICNQTLNNKILIASDSMVYEMFLDKDFKITELPLKTSMTLKSIAYIDDKLAVGGSENNVKIYDFLKNYEETKVLLLDSAVLALFAYKYYLAVGQMNGILKLFNSLSDFTLIETIKNHDSGVRCFTMNASYLFSGGWDGNICVWDETSMNQINLVEKMTAHKGESYKLLIHEDRLYSIGYDTNVHIIDLKIGFKTFKSFTTHKVAGSCLAVYNQKLITSGWDGEIKVWDIKNDYALLITFVGSQTQLYSLIIKDDMLISGGLGKQIAIWDLSNDFKQKSKTDLKGSITFII